MAVLDALDRRANGPETGASSARRRMAVAMAMAARGPPWPTGQQPGTHAPARQLQPPAAAGPQHRDAAGLRPQPGAARVVAHPAGV